MSAELLNTAEEGTLQGSGLSREEAAKANGWRDRMGSCPQGSLLAADWSSAWARVPRSGSGRFQPTVQVSSCSLFLGQECNIVRVREMAHIKGEKDPSDQSGVKRDSLEEEVLDMCKVSKEYETDIYLMLYIS